MSLKWPPKDKDETLDYSIDWSRGLETNETIQAVSWSILNADDEKVSFSNGTTVNGLKNQTQTNTTTVATIYLANGTDNKEYKLFCSITTNQGRVKERAVVIRIREYN
jgi:hypothetical protein